jgi:large subunit ribosomal protein L1
MAKRGKKYTGSRAKVEALKVHLVEEAIALMKECSWAKFDESVDVAVNLGVNPKYSDQMVRGAIVLPHGVGKTVRVAVFAKGDKAKEAEEAGADIVGGEELAERVEAGFLDFDKAIATPDMMKVVGKLGKVLGPRGMMPNPKVGTVTQDIAKAVSETKGGKVEFRVDKEGIVHAPVGKVSFENNKIKQNLAALVEALNKAKPASAKGVYFKNATLSSTMGPGIRLDLADLTSISSL